MDYLIVVSRTVFFYIFIILIFRLMGKREIGQLSIQDLVISILVAELAAISIEKKEETILLTIVPIIMLLFLQILFAIVSMKSNKFRSLIDGQPSLIIDKGIINFSEMVKQRYTLDDLMLELRSKKVKNIADIEYAVLENDGSLSIFKYNFLKLDTANPFPLILDGVVQKDTLKYLNKNNSWLKQVLVNKNIKLDNVFYAFYKNNDVYIIKKSDTK